VIYNPFKDVALKGLVNLLALMTAFLCTVVSPVVAKLCCQCCPKSDKHADAELSATRQNTLSGRTIYGSS